jgi:RHS repeat-associated protein
MSTLQIHHRSSRASQAWADVVRAPRPNRATTSPAADVTHYEYGPFGELIRATGPMAKLNPFRFSTKYQDDETDLLYYGYRYYNPSTGRWLSRDPIGERGGRNLYAFVNNQPTVSCDKLGLQITPGVANTPQYGPLGPTGLARDLIEHYFTGNGQLFTEGGDELSQNPGVKGGVKSEVFDLAGRLCGQYRQGVNYGTESIQVAGVQPTGFWLVQTLNMPNPNLSMYVHYKIEKNQNCCCVINLSFDNTWYDKADLHRMRDGGLLFPDFILLPLQDVGIGHEFPIQISWSASGVAKVCSGRRGPAVTGTGWPFE